MIFYLLHNFINNIEYTKDWYESKKNCFTLIIGGTLYILLYVLLEYLYHKTGNMFLRLLHKFFLGFVIVDAFGMAIMYKLFYGRSIMNELDPYAESEWQFDGERYKRKRDISIDEMRRFNESSKNLDDLVENIDDIRENIQELDKKTEEISEAVMYHPDGEFAQEFKRDFENISSTISKKE
jgi:methyl-accepting chemotaxis protein